MVAIENDRIGRMERVDRAQRAGPMATAGRPPWRPTPLPGAPAAPGLPGEATRTAASPHPTSPLAVPAPADDPADAWGAARWRRESGKVAAFILVLLVLEGANWYLLTAAFAWVLPEPLLPQLAAFALIVVLVGTVLSRSLLTNPALRSHRRRLWVTLRGLLALQFTVNTVEGFGVARGHLPATAGQFFQLDPAVMARVVGVVLGGGLALITFSYLLLVARILEEMLPPPDLQRDAELLLRRYERRGARAAPGSGTPPPDLADPTVRMPAADHHASETLPATRFWAFLRQRDGGKA